MVQNVGSITLKGTGNLPGFMNFVSVKDMHYKSHFTKWQKSASSLGLLVNEVMGSLP